VALGFELLNAEHSLIAEKPDEQEAALGALQKRFSAALSAAELTSRSAKDFLSRVPSLGWPDAEPDRNYFCVLLARASVVGVVLGLLGWALTALMVSFGAPFWFDLISKLINRRVTGPRPVDD
jgi:hypothetical protein